VAAATTISPSKRRQVKRKGGDKDMQIERTRRQRLPLHKEGTGSCSRFPFFLNKNHSLSSSGKWLLACKEVARLIQPDEQLGNSWRWYKWH
jgi:hypothetical protein